MVYAKSKSFKVTKKKKRTIDIAVKTSCRLSDPVPVD